jgi:hypothetical protein
VTAIKGQPGQDIPEITTGEDSQEKATRKRPPGKNSQKYIGKIQPGTEQPGQDSEERTARTGQAHLL